MEMPEGWKKLNADIGRALILMKEMAEILEDVCLNSDATKINWNKANQILEKFKEWK